MMVAMVAVDHQHDRAAEVGGDLRVELEFVDGVLAQEVRAFHEDELVFGLELLELLHDGLDDQVMIAAVDDLAGLLVGVDEGLRIVLPQFELLHHEMDVRVAVGHLGGVDDGPENGHVAHTETEHVHDAQSRGGLAGQGACGGEIQGVHVSSDGRQRGCHTQSPGCAMRGTAQPAVPLW